MNRLNEEGPCTNIKERGLARDYLILIFFCGTGEQSDSDASDKLGGEARCPGNPLGSIWSFAVVRIDVAGLWDGRADVEVRFFGYQCLKRWKRKCSEFRHGERKRMGFELSKKVKREKLTASLTVLETRIRSLRVPRFTLHSKCICSKLPERVSLNDGFIIWKLKKEPGEEFTKISWGSNSSRFDDVGIILCCFRDDMLCWSSLSWSAPPTAWRTEILFLPIVLVWGSHLCTETLILWVPSPRSTPILEFFYSERKSHRSWKEGIQTHLIWSTHLRLKSADDSFNIA